MDRFPTIDRKKTAASRKVLKALGVSSLLTKPAANPKIYKNQKVSNVLTAGLHLAPADLSGWNVCAMASPGCKAACLHTAGNPAYMEGKNRARIARTKAFKTHQADFMRVLIAEIAALSDKAAKQGIDAAARLNVTSDIRYEKIFIQRDDMPVLSMTIFNIFPDIKFYDYTKIPNRRDLPENYHLTFSLAENNLKAAVKELEAGINVAAVFDAALPSHYVLNNEAYKVINGDLTDYRPDDGKDESRPVIVGLKAKGDAKKDKSGFVRSSLHAQNDADAFISDGYDERTKPEKLVKVA